jgi:hypothetical protein
MYHFRTVVQCTYGRRSDDVMGLVASSVVFHFESPWLHHRARNYLVDHDASHSLRLQPVSCMADRLSSWLDDGPRTKSVYVRYHGQLENFSWAVIVAIMELSACLFKLWIYCQSLLVIPLWSFSTNLTEWVQSVSCLSRQSIFNRL